MSVFNHPVSNQLDLPGKLVEKVVMGGASTKDRFCTPHHNIETTSPQLDNTWRLSRMIEETLEICYFTLKHEPK